FKYSPREHTKAYSWGDDVPHGVKVSRLNELIDLQHRISYDLNQSMVGASVEVLVEGPSKKSTEQWMGRTDTNKVVVFPKADCKAGEYARVEVERANSATLFGTVQTLNNRKAFTNL
ncbi:MAG TPA: TRAM domain-containing protein, partial [Bacteroidota bacterium]